MTRPNPELRRYAWLELSKHRLIMMPVVLAIIFFLASRTADSAGSIYVVAETIFLLLLGVQGGHKAAESVLDEVNDNTWDWQRLSSLSPWTLTIGKLLGSTSYSWYGAFMALAFYVWSGLSLMPVYYVFWNSVLLVCAGLICHAGALHVSLLHIQNRPSARKKTSAIGPQVLGILMGLGALSMTMSRVHLQTNPSYVSSLQWYGHSYEVTAFFATYNIIFLLWLIAGSYWLMRSQLCMRAGPWLWTGYMLFMMTYLSGFTSSYGTSAPLGSEVIAFGVGLILVYGMAITEPCGGVFYRRLKERWQRGNRAAFLDVFPRWVISFGIVILLTAWIAITHRDNIQLTLVLLAYLCFAVRDIALLHFFKLHPQSRRALAATLFYLAILYILLPLLMDALFKLLGWNAANHLFYMAGVYEDHIGITLASGALQAALMVSFAFGRWKRYWQLTGS